MSVESPFRDGDIIYAEIVYLTTPYKILGKLTTSRFNDPHQQNRTQIIYAIKTERETRHAFGSEIKTVFRTTKTLWELLYEH